MRNDEKRRPSPNPEIPLRIIRGLGVHSRASFKGKRSVRIPSLLTARIMNSKEYHSKNFIFSTSDSTNEKNDLSVLGTLNTTEPAGHSIYNVLNFVQNLLNDRFAKYDYGPKKNLKM